MKSVTVYTLGKKEVMMYDGQDVYEYIELRDSVPIYSDNDEFVSPTECAAKKIQLPIRLYRTIGKDDLYVAWDREILKLLNLEEEQVEAKLFSKNRHINFLESELERISNMSAWETVKVAWAKLWSK